MKMNCIKNETFQIYLTSGMARDAYCIWCVQFIFKAGSSIAGIKLKKFWKYRKWR